MRHMSLETFIMLVPSSYHLYNNISRTIIFVIQDVLGSLSEYFYSPLLTTNDHLQTNEVLCISDVQNAASPIKILPFLGVDANTGLASSFTVLI